MKIIFIVPDLGSGGAERVVSVLGKEFVEKGISVEIVMLFTDRIQYSLPSSVKIRKMHLLTFPLWHRIKRLRALLKQIKKEDKRTSAFVFQDSCLKYVIAASIGLSIYIVSSERNNPYIKGNSFIQKIKAVLPYLLSSHTVFQTPKARAYYKMLPNKKCSIIPNPITISNNRWKGILLPSKLVSVCRLHEQKNLPMSLEVIDILKKRFPTIHLDIYGEGDLKDMLEQQIKEHHLEENITLCGTTQNVVDKLADASVFISTSDFEGISNSMLEAMSVGMPIICTDCPIGGAEMMLGDDAGILSPIGNSEMFAAKLAKLLLSETYARSLGQRALLKSYKFSPVNIAEKWLSIIK